MLWIISLVLVWIVVRQQQLTERMQDAEKELQRVRNTVNHLAAQREQEQPVATSTPSRAPEQSSATVLQKPDVPLAAATPAPRTSDASENAWAAEIARAKLAQQTAIPNEPGLVERAINAAKNWITQGNVPVKVGVVVTFFGIAALLRYGYTQGYLQVSIEIRLLALALVAIAALIFGWREREQKRAFGLSLQGGALGALMLIVFAAFRNYHVLPAGTSFVLIVLLVACAALLALKQSAVWIALLGFLGGYLAPLLLSTGSGNHIALFSYYAILNAAVFAIAWHSSWRALNLMGFAFTFVIGALWGVDHYRPEKFNTVEPFLILFFLFYVAIGYLYVLKQTEHRRPWVDGTLVFGTPLLAFALQARLLENQQTALAASAGVLALLYAGLMYSVHRHRNERLLVESYGGLAIAFATLAVPLAFSTGTTASLWALEGVGLVWVGIRQYRNTAIGAGILLQILAGIAYVDFISSAAPATTLLMNAIYWGAVLMAVSGFTISRMFERAAGRIDWAHLCFVWAIAWWLCAGIGQFALAERGMGLWPFAMLYLAATIFIAGVLHAVLTWPNMRRLAGFSAVAAPMAVFWAKQHYGTPLMPETLPYWAALLLAGGIVLQRAAREEALAALEIRAMHCIALWTAALALTLQWLHGLNVIWQVAEGWYVAASVLPLLLMTLALWPRNPILAWPLQQQFEAYRNAWFTPAMLFLALAWVWGLFSEGDATPMPYVPILNPLDVMLMAVAGVVFVYMRQSQNLRQVAIHAWPYVGFIFITLATLRAVHHLDHQPWNATLLATGLTQASLTVVWSLLGVTALILGSRRSKRRQWLGGGLLMLVVLVKLILIDRTYMGNIPGIVSFLAVGLLLVAVGYFAPQPPKEEAESSGSK